MISNKAFLIGRLTQDIPWEPKGENNAANFTVACNRYSTKSDHPEADFIDCVAWNKTGEHCAKYFHKGDRMGLEGYLRTEVYENTKFSDENGNHPKIKSTKFIVDNVTFIETKATAAKPSGNTEGNDVPQSTTTEAPITEEVEDEELPF